MLRRLREELPNLRAAFEWLAAGETDEIRVEDALHLAGSLGWFWHFGRHVEGPRRAAARIALEGGSPAPGPRAAGRLAGRAAALVPGAPQSAVRRNRRGADIAMIRRPNSAGRAPARSPVSVASAFMARGTAGEGWQMPMQGGSHAGKPARRTGESQICAVPRYR